MKKISFILFIYFLRFSAFAQENSKDNLFSKYRFVIKTDVFRACLLHPKFSFDYFINDKFSLESGFGFLRWGQRISYLGIAPVRYDAAYIIGVGPAKGFDFFSDAKVVFKTTNWANFYFGLGYYYRYSFLKKFPIRDFGGETYYLNENVYPILCNRIN